MRITHRMLIDTVRQNLEVNLRRLDTLENQLSSGKRIQRPSDDPPAVVRALGFREAIAASEQYARNLDASLAWVNATEAALGGIMDTVHRARELAVQGGSDTLGQSERNAIAAEVDQLVQHLLTIANSSLRGQRLFAGLATSSDPFSYSAGPPASVTYAGDTGQMRREIDTGVTVTINVNGTFLPPIFTALLDLANNLRAGNTTAIRSSDLAALDTALDTVSTTRAGVGATVNRLEEAQQRLQEIEERLRGLLSSTEDTDLTQVISDFAAQESVYKAALAAGARAIQPSLLDYLRG
jgi:flagellar hook-associated protein 3 FlgL